MPPLASIFINYFMEIFIMDEHGKGISIQHYDHDYHAKGYGGYGHGCAGGWGIFGVVGFIAFIVILWGVWAAHNRSSDHHHDQLRYHNDTQRGMDKLSYQFGRIDKQLDEIEAKEVAILRGGEKIYDRQCYQFENMQQYGVKYGDQTKPLCTARPQYCGGSEGYGGGGGGVWNGNQMSRTDTTAIDHSAFGGRGI